MRALTEKERTDLDRRRASFETFLAERMPVLKDFMERLGLPDAPLVLVQAGRFLPALDQWMRDQVVTPGNRVWVLTRLGYFIGEFLVQRFGGHWFLNDVPDSRYFARYVVGQFPGARNPSAMVDPFQVADAYLSEPPGRSLSGILAQVELEVRQT